MADLGDLTDFMKEGSLVDLNWLDVNEADYRALDTLPKQNLDSAPDLEALWGHRDESALRFVPNMGNRPHTMLDVAQDSSKRIASAVEGVVRTARLALMQTTDTKKVLEILASRYDKAVLKEAKTALIEVLAERGLLGQIYVAATDFPECSKGSKAASEFVKRFAPGARYILAKEACGDCCHRQVLPDGVNSCNVMGKELQSEIPYTEVLASEIERQQKSLGKAVKASEGATPRERIRLAMLAESAGQRPSFTGHTQIAPAPKKVDTNQVLIAAESLTKKRDADNRTKLAAAKASPVLATLRREMLKGRTEADLIHTMKLSFGHGLLEETSAEWLPLFRQAGLYGSVYTTQDSFENCREGADFLQKHASRVRAVVAGDKCASCIYNQGTRCAMYNRPLVASADEVLTSAMVDVVVDGHCKSGKLPRDASNINWGSSPVEALKAVHAAAARPIGSNTPTFRATVERAYYGSLPAISSQTSDKTKQEIARTASQYMNEGLYGEDLLNVLKSRFVARDLVASAEALREVLSEQGLQGIKFIDPTAYADYGKGCKEASLKHRTRLAVKYVKAGDKCAGCAHQTVPGFCTALEKRVVVEPPYVDKRAEQQAVLASGKSTQVSYASLMNNGLSMMQEFQLQHQNLDVNVDPAHRGVEASIEFGAQEIKL